MRPMTPLDFTVSAVRVSAGLWGMQMRVLRIFAEAGMERPLRFWGFPAADGGAPDAPPCALAAPMMSAAAIRNWAALRRPTVVQGGKSGRAATLCRPVARPRVITEPAGEGGPPV
ncbi:hypothetical protein [Salipiger sp.]|uniref:hypothetical protein n=1 Tax=Salipiger sp. TaxID=2078585 RepID=UPI003A971C9F